MMSKQLNINNNHNKATYKVGGEWRKRFWQEEEEEEEEQERKEKQINKLIKRKRKAEEEFNM